MHVFKLLEGLSSVLFFFTKNDSAYNIIKNGYVDLGLSSRNSYEMNLSKNMFFLSTTRSRTGGFHKDKSGGTLFQLDGNKLKQKYAGKPIDYYVGSKHMPDEMEDRIITNHSKIPLIDYVTKADVHWSDNAKAVYIALRKINIPVFVYKNQKDWLLGNSKNAMSHEEIMADSSRISPKKDSYISSPKTEQESLNAILKLYNAKTLDEINYHTRVKIKELLSGSGHGLRVVLNNIGINWRKRDYFSEQINKLTRIYKRENISNAEEFATLLNAKLDELYNAEEDKRAKIDMINTLGKLEKMVSAIDNGEDPIESAARFVNEDIKEYPSILENMLIKFFSRVHKFHTDKLEQRIKDIFPVLRKQDFTVEDQYNNSKYRAEIALRDLGIYL